MVLIDYILKDGKRTDEDGFRPLAGIMVLIMTICFSFVPSVESFRPLAGIMVLINRNV